MTRLTSFIVGAMLVFAVTACSTVEKVDTPLKKWAVATESYNAVKAVVIGLTEDGHLSLPVAQKALTVMVAGDKVVLDSSLVIVNGKQEDLLDYVFLILGYSGELKSIVEEFK